MLRVLSCITDEHDLRLVVVAGMICLFACFTALGMVARARASHRRLDVKWIAGAAVVTGCGVWATHFVAMLAFRPNLPIGYDIELTVASVLIAIAISAAGFMLAATGRYFIAIGGAVVGLGVGAMHYVGMMAVRVPAHVHYDAGYVAASIELGAVIAVPAVLLAVRRLDMRSRLLGALLLTLAICGLHFTAMASLTLEPNPMVPLPDVVIDPEWLAIALAAMTVLIVALGLVGTVVDEHLKLRAINEAERLRAHVSELEATKQRLEQTTAALSTALESAAAGSLAKSQFLATMSHELRTPLNAVIGFSELLANERLGPLGNARYRDYAHDIKNSGEHLLALINDVLDLSKLDMGRLGLNEETFSLASVAEEAMRMMSTRAAQSGLDLRADVAADLPMLQGDVLRVRQVLINLLSNAVKFTPREGTVELVARRSALGVTVQIRDTGIGIAPQDIPKALERFGQVDSRLERRYEGSGLGLTIAKRLTELHDGTLEIASVVGQGTTVTITFPESRVALPAADSRAA
jgi:signal transduction histidine kinase